MRYVALTVFALTVALAVAGALDLFAGTFTQDPEALASMFTPSPHPTTPA